MHKIGPALAGGNAVVHKPAEETPLSALRLMFPSCLLSLGARPGSIQVTVQGGTKIVLDNVRNIWQD